MFITILISIQLGFSEKEMEEDIWEDKKKGKEIKRYKKNYIINCAREGKYGKRTIMAKKLIVWLFNNLVSS